MEENKQVNAQGGENRKKRYHHHHHKKNPNAPQNGEAVKQNNGTQNTDGGAVNDSFANGSRRGDQIVTKKQNAPQPADGETKAQGEGNNGQPGSGKRRNRHKKHKPNGAQNGQTVAPQQNAQQPSVPANNAPVTDGQNGGKKKKKHHKRHGSGNGNQAPEIRNESAAVSSFASAMNVGESVNVEKTYFELNRTIRNRSETVEEDIDVSHLLNEEKTVDEREKTDVIGVRFRGIGKMYYFDPQGKTYAQGVDVIVETSRGQELAHVAQANKAVYSEGLVLPLKPCLRQATKEDYDHLKQNGEFEKKAREVFIRRTKELNLPMDLFDAQCSFDNTNILFYFKSEDRVDFRELIRVLASELHSHIELRQIGGRDEARIIGGIGPCGRAVCCASHLSGFVRPTPKMAKEQGVMLNSTKSSGICGGLLCCLQYEAEQYNEALQFCPPVGKTVKTPEGIGKVTSVNPLTGVIKVYIRDEVKETGTVKTFSVPDVQLIEK